MNDVFITIATFIIHKGIDKFKCGKFGVEFRKNKVVGDIEKIVNTLNTKCKDDDDKILILSISIKNILKISKERKITVVHNHNGYYTYDHITTNKSFDTIKQEDPSVVVLLSGHCKPNC